MCNLFGVLAAAAAAVSAGDRPGFVKKVDRETTHNIVNPMPHEYVPDSAVPAAFDWRAAKDGKSHAAVNLLTPMLNQHLPQFCGSCWAHGAVSALQDRIKIARHRAGDVSGMDIQLSIQEILNCHGGGTCYGGDQLAAYEWVHENNIAFLTGMPYSACSSDSKEGFCGHSEWTCDALGRARTCGTFGEKCVGLDQYPEVTVEEFGPIPTDTASIQKEVMTRGPLACGVNANAIVDYNGGIIDLPNASQEIDHVISIVGWGEHPKGRGYWIVRNSWGEFWGEMGFFRVRYKQLGLNADCAFAMPKSWTTKNFSCNPDGSNCDSPNTGSGKYGDPLVELDV